MMEFAIQTERLTKDYGAVRAVDTVSLRVHQGEIYGFLGLNGAGKTTTIRALLGMIQPTVGTVTILGQTIAAPGQGPWQQVGYLVEAPAIYPELTVRENLEIARQLYKVKDSKATTAVMAQLALNPYADRKAGTLSMGNRQRLGLARALLHRPSLLILDEPANGLDPAGVVEIRTLLRRLASEEGITIFMSSHILTEVDRLANRIGIIHAGCLVEELDTSQLERLRGQRLEVQTRDLNAAYTVLRNAAYMATLQRETAQIAITDPRAIQAPDEIAQLLVHAGIPLTRLAVVQDNLEDHFLQLTGATA